MCKGHGSPKTWIKEPSMIKIMLNKCNEKSYKVDRKREAVVSIP